MFTALAHWVEDGVAPAQVIATKYVGNDASKGIEMQRPLCSYPQRAWYKGDGDTNDAKNFTCAGNKYSGNPRTSENRLTESPGSIPLIG